MCSNFFGYPAKELGEIKNPEAFLLTAFKNRLIDLYRADKSKPSFEVTPDVPSTQDIIEDLESDAALIERIAGPIKTSGPLPACYLHEILQGLTTEQIVEETGFTYQTVYNNLSKGIQLLRRNLTDHSGKIANLKLAALLGILFSQNFFE
ncbi:sigma-70 family RNA polymerase sigma factor [Niabella defluvii]|nr:sigma-70 family RNA polymerase sigma factor [Niabella sp. I65]